MSSLSYMSVLCLAAGLVGACTGDVPTSPTQPAATQSAVEATPGATMTAALPSPSPSAPLVSLTPTVSHTPPTPGEPTPTLPPTPGPYEGNTVGVLKNTGEAAPGYTLFHPMPAGLTYLIDLEGEVVHQWGGRYRPGLSVYLLEDGRLLRTGSLNNQSPVPRFDSGGTGGYIELVSWDGIREWSYEYSDLTVRQHHDVEMMPNGNILMIAWELKLESEALMAGRRPDLIVDGELWPDHVIEVDPSTNDIVWEWHVWDHLVQDYIPGAPNYGIPSEKPHRVDINYVFDRVTEDWTHINAIEYDEAHDQILLSVFAFSEIWVIDHSTTTEEAASSHGGRQGKGGDLLFRWGNPAAWGAGDLYDSTFFGQHDAHFIAEGLEGEGDMLVFNNGRTDSGGPGYSSVDQLTLPQASDGSWPVTSVNSYGPDDLAWRFTTTPPKDMQANILSGAQRLPNGNTLICEGTKGKFLEVNPDDEIVWVYVSPITGTGTVQQGDEVPTIGNGQGTNMVFRATRYAPDYPAFQGRDLSPKGALEHPLP